MLIKIANQIFPLEDIQYINLEAPAYGEPEPVVLVHVKFSDKPIAFSGEVAAAFRWFISTQTSFPLADIDYLFKQQKSPEKKAGPSVEIRNRRLRPINPLPRATELRGPSAEEQNREEGRSPLPIPPAAYKHEDCPLREEHSVMTLPCPACKFPS